MVIFVTKQYMLYSSRHIKDGRKRKLWAGSPKLRTATLHMIITRASKHWYLIHLSVSWKWIVYRRLPLCLTLLKERQRKQKGETRMIHSKFSGYFHLEDSNNLIYPKTHIQDKIFIYPPAHIQAYIY